MKLYIVFPGQLYPMIGMSQVRMLNQLRSLSLDHQIVFSDLISRHEALLLAEKNLAELNIEYKPIFAPNYGKGKVIRAYKLLIRKMLYHLLTTTKEELALRSGHLQRQILDIAKSSNIDVFMIHYWYLGNLFHALDKRILRMIDTHYVVEENIELQDKYNASGYKRWKLKQELKHSLEMQRKFFLGSDLVIVNSARQKELIHQWNPKIPVNITNNGQDLTQYLNYLPESEPEQAICFYGSLSNQFNRKALQRVLVSIYPAVRAALPGTKLYIIGADPPMDIIGSASDPSVIVTGFVDDVKPFLTKCKLMLLPLETGSGFRGRTVEVMALGIPIIGTDNALQSVGFIDDKHGYIEETDVSIAQRTIELLGDKVLLDRMSANCREYARERFSLKATFGKLSLELSNMDTSRRSS